MSVKPEETLALKKPYLVYILAICFMLAPFGNLVIALYSSGIPKWYSPYIWWRLFTSQSAADIIILSSIFVAGVALTIQKKTSWFFAVIVLVVVTLNNLFFMETSPKQALSPWYIPLLLNAPILVVLYFFRYPYLDKRDHILKGTHKRYQVDIPVKFPKLDLDATMKSLSRGGCFVTITGEFQKKIIAGETIDISWDGALSSALIVYVNKNGAGLQFSKPEKAFKNHVRTTIAKSE